MNAARSSDSVDNFVTEGGIRISRERHETPYAGAIENYLDRLAARGMDYEFYRYDAGHGSLVVAETIKQVAIEVHFAQRTLGLV